MLLARAALGALLITGLLLLAAAQLVQERPQVQDITEPVPVSLVELCHQYILAIQQFLPHCNPNITSDAKVGIMQVYVIAVAQQAVGIASEVTKVILVLEVPSGDFGPRRLLPSVD